MNSITIALADDHQLFRWGMVELLREFEHLKILFDAGNGKDLCEKLQETKPDIILMDIEMPEMDGIRATALIREKYPEIKVIMLTMHDGVEMICHLVQIGANGFLHKNSEIEVVIEAINHVYKHGYYFDERVSNALAKSLIKTSVPKSKFNAPELTKREIEVVRLICEQHTIREIADILCISPRTVDSYRENIFTKTDSRNIAGVVIYAIKNKLFSEHFL
jgi:DNA-binding NarL/FixJ family response regulator